VDISEVAIENGTNGGLKMAKANAKKQAAPKATKPAAAPKAKKATNGKVVAAKAAAPTVVTTVTQDDVARVAYAIWERKGRPSGQDAANWAEAERELNMR
jgi:predicted phage tail protein